MKAVHQQETAEDQSVHSQIIFDLAKGCRASGSPMNQSRCIRIDSACGSLFYYIPERLGSELDVIESNRVGSIHHKYQMPGCGVFIRFNNNGHVRIFLRHLLEASFQFSFNFLLTDRSRYSCWTGEEATTSGECPLVVALWESVRFQETLMDQ